MLLSILTPLLASTILAESVGPVGTPGLVPLGIALFMLVLFGWGVVQRSWQTTIFDQEEAARQAEATRQAEEASSPEPGNMQKNEEDHHS